MVAQAERTWPPQLVGMTIWGPIPALDGEGGRPVPEGFLGAATRTTNGRPRSSAGQADAYEHRDEAITVPAARGPIRIRSV